MTPEPAGHDPESLLARMTLDEKVGQMTQVTLQALTVSAVIICCPPIVAFVLNHRPPS